QLTLWIGPAGSGHGGSRWRPLHRFPSRPVPSATTCTTAVLRKRPQRCGHRIRRSVGTFDRSLCAKAGRHSRRIQETSGHRRAGSFSIQCVESEMESESTLQSAVRGHSRTADSSGLAGRTGGGGKPYASATEAGDSDDRAGQVHGQARRGLEAAGGWRTFWRWGENWTGSRDRQASRPTRGPNRRRRKINKRHARGRYITSVLFLRSPINSRNSPSRGLGNRFIIACGESRQRSHNTLAALGAASQARIPHRITSVPQNATPLRPLHRTAPKNFAVFFF